MKKVLKDISKAGLGQLTIPVIAIALLVLFNLFRDPSFFSVGITHNNDGNVVLAGNLISIINSASELAILAMGMTLVTAACGGQDISVGAAAAIAGSAFVKILKSGGGISGPTVLAAFLTACVVAMLFGTFNGTLVAVFRIQPMIATLILYTCGRYWNRQFYSGHTDSDAGHYRYCCGNHSSSGIPLYLARTAHTVRRNQRERGKVERD